MNPQELLELIIDTLVKHGEVVTIAYDTDNNVKTYDLNVNLKSRIILSIEDQQLIASTRYDKREVIKTPLDLLQIYDYWFNDAISRFNYTALQVPKGWLALYSMASVLPPQGK